jgi:hypothetical protein
MRLSWTAHRRPRWLRLDGGDGDGDGGGGRVKPGGVAGLMEDDRLPARALGYLFLAGATIGLVSLLLPLPPRAHIGGLYSNVALAYAAGAFLVLCGSRLPGWVLHLALTAGAVLITRAVVLSGEPVSFYSVWFIWVGLYACCFFSPASAAGHMVFVAAL